MEKTYLPLVGDYALEVLSYYIWGQSSKPSNIADEKYANKNAEHILEAKFMLLKGHFMANQNGICVK